MECILVIDGNGIGVEGSAASHDLKNGTSCSASHDQNIVVSCSASHDLNIAVPCSKKHDLNTDNSSVVLTCRSLHPSKLKHLLYRFKSLLLGCKVVSCFISSCISRCIHTLTSCSLSYYLDTELLSFPPVCNSPVVYSTDA